MYTVVALIPCYNEESGIAEVLAAMPHAALARAGYTLRAVVIDNNSTDRTAEFAAAAGAEVVSELKRGKGNAMRRGFEYAGTIPDVDYIVMLDGDATYRPEELLRMLEPLSSGFASVVIGSRLGGKISEDSMRGLNRAGNWLYSHLVRYFYRVNVTDVLTGYFAWTAPAALRLAPYLQSEGFALEMEMVTKMARLGEDITSVPISYHPRKGESSLHPVRDGIRILAMFARNLFWRMPRKPEPKLKNIVIISSYYPPHLGGLENVAKNQAELLSSAGNRVTVLTSKVSPEERSYAKENLQVIRVRALNFFERFGVPFPIFSPWFAVLLVRHIRKADIVHIHDSFYMSSFLGAFFAWLLGKPVVLTQHVAMIYHPSRLVMMMQQLVYATTGAVVFAASMRIITLNDRVEQFLIHHGVSPQKLIQLSNGVDLKLFHPVPADVKKRLRAKYNLSSDKRIVLFVGRFVPKKGFDKLLAAQSEEYQLVFVGGSVPQSASEQVIFLGKVPYEEMAEIYQTADIFVLPSEGEGFPLSVQEAMATGLPIVTTHDDGYHRYNLDRNLIYFLDNPTEATIRHALTSILQSDAQLQRMSSYSYQYAESYFGWPAILQELIHIYDTLQI